MGTKVRASTQLTADSATFTALSVTATASTSNHVVNLSALEQKVTQGKIWKEAILHTDQLKSGVAGGIRAATAIWGIANFNDSETVVLKNGSGTETYTAKDAPGGGNEFQIGGTLATSLANLQAIIEANSSYFSASVATDLSSFGGAATHVIITCNDESVSTNRIYGTASSIRHANYSSTTYDYSLPSSLHNLAGVDPTNTNFGFNRTTAGLVGGETHIILDGQDLPYSWDADGEAWQLTSAGVAAGNGVEVSGVTVAVKRDTTLGANLASAIYVSSNGTAIRIDDSTIDYNAANGQLRVKAGGISNNELGADCVDGGNIVDAAIGPEHIADGSVGAAALGAAAVGGVALNMTREQEVGDGVTDTFVLANAPYSADFLFAYVGGVLQKSGDDFTLTDDTIEYAVPPGDGDIVQHIYFQ